MQTALEPHFLSVEEYLSGEHLSEIRHEYVDGVVYAMAGTSDVHNIIAGNLFAALHPHLRGGKCRAFVSDVKVRLQLGEKHIFYYPDVMVACDPRDTNAFFKDSPQVIVEVLSESTERTDRTEKFWNYTQIPTLEEYVLASQDRMEVAIFRRSTRWKPEVHRLPNQEVHLASLNFKVQLKAIYEGVER
jgi:Uma2 family endonuclease